MRKVKLFLIIVLIGILSIPTVYSEETNDEIDQEQINYNASASFLGGVLFAQSFVPNVDTLTRVELLIYKMGDLYGNSVLSIRESLTGNDLTSVSKESVEIGNDLEWVEFDFPNIQVTPGDSYYIIVDPDPDSDGGEGFNFIAWAFSWEDLYLKGAPYWHYNFLWNDGIPSHSSADYAFKTYGNNENNQDTIEISISAGNFNMDIGRGVSIDVLNYRNEPVNIEYSITRDRYFVKDFPETYTNNFTAPAEDYWSSLIGIGNEFIIYNLEISAWFEEYRVDREGIAIGELVFLK